MNNAGEIAGFYVDVPTGAAVLMLVVAALAGFIPARRASRVDPMVALRYE